MTKSPLFHVEKMRKNEGFSTFFSSMACGAAEILISINDLLTNQDNPVSEVQKVKSILLQYMSELKQIFRYYSQSIVPEDISRTTSKGRANTPLAQTTSLIKLLPWQQKTTADNAFAMSMVDFWKFAKGLRCAQWIRTIGSRWPVRWVERCAGAPPRPRVAGLAAWPCLASSLGQCWARARNIRLRGIGLSRAR